MGIYIPYQKALTLADLARATVDLYGNKATRLKLSGARVGEKLHELLFAEGERIISSLDSNRSQNSQRWSAEEIRNWLRQLDKYS